MQRRSSRGVSKLDVEIEPGISKSRKKSESIVKNTLISNLKKSNKGHTNSINSDLIHDESDNQLESNHNHTSFSVKYFDILQKESNSITKQRTTDSSGFEFSDPSTLKQSCIDLIESQKSDSNFQLYQYQLQFQLYTKWTRFLHASHHLAVFGIGNKLEFIELFVKTQFPDILSIVLNSHTSNHTSFSELIQIILSETAHLPPKQHTFSSSSTQNQTLQSIQLIKQRFQSNPNQDADSLQTSIPPLNLILIIHGLENALIHSGSTGSASSYFNNLRIFSELCDIPGLGIIATLEHGNGGRFVMIGDRWIFCELSTFTIPVLHELVSETQSKKKSTVSGSSHLLLRKESNAQGQYNAVIALLNSLTPNARSIFKLLCTECVLETEQDDEDTVKSVNFQEFYSLCRQKWIVSTPTDLRIVLREFVDHQVIEIKRGIDAAELLSIQLPNDCIRQVLEYLER